MGFTGPTDVHEGFSEVHGEFSNVYIQYIFNKIRGLKTYYNSVFICNFAEIYRGLKKVLPLLWRNQRRICGYK